MNDTSPNTQDFEAAGDAAVTPAASIDPAPWPLFYRRPQLLAAAHHGQWRVKDLGMGFAADTNSVPIVVSEFAAATHWYPLVFAGPEHGPVAVLGLESRNRFVDGRDWRAGAYVPAYVRRYPFVFAEVGAQAGLALAIDAEAPMLVEGGDEGLALFDNGVPTDLTRRALAFCEGFTRENLATRAFVAALQEQRLLVERAAHVALPQGRGTSLGGFSVVSPESFAALPEAVVVDWHRKGWLALIHAHLASMARFSDLLAP